MKQAYNINPSVGGPILRDKVWFFASARFQDNQNYVAGLYVNKNAGDPTKWLPDPDRTQQGVFRVTQKGGNARVTWQAAQKHKFSFYYDDQGRIWDDSRATISPESTVGLSLPHAQPDADRLDVHHDQPPAARGALRHRGEAFGNQYPEEGSIYRELIPVHRADQQPAVPG